MRLSNMVFAYFLIGGLLMTGGVIDAGEAAPVEMFVDNPDTDPAADDRVSASDGGILDNLASSVQNALSTVAGGGLITALNAIRGILTLVAWPYTALEAMNAPWQMSLLVGGGLTTMFVLSALRVVRGSI